MTLSAWGISPGPLLDGALTTLGLTALAIVFGQLLGLAIAVLRWRKVPLLGPLLALYVSLVRATPLLTLALAVFFLSPALGYDLSPSVAAVLSMSVNTSAFNAEIWRGGFAAFPRDQFDATRAAGMSSTLAMRRILFPQVLRKVLPALVNEVTVLIKNSPAIAIIGIVDLTRAAVRMGADSYKPLPPLIAVLVLYIVIVFVIVTLQRQFERRLAAKYA